MSAEQQAKIRTIAQRLWEEDGRPGGRDLEYWLRAEKLATAKAKPAAKAAPVKKAAPAAKAPAAKKPAARKPAVKK